MPESNESAPVERADVYMRWGVKIPLRDGIRLNAALYLPKIQEHPAPAIFTLTPYIGQTYHETGMYFAAHGYPFLIVDVRGRGNSEGMFKPNINEGKDGHDVVEWLAKQSYCDGQVTMWGGSYGGFDQWNTAREFPAHLATIVPVASPYMAVDFPMRGNVASPYLMQWLTLVSGRTSQEKIFADQTFWNSRFKEWFESGAPFKDLDSQLGNPSAIFQEWLAHPHQDGYWDSYNPTAEQYAKLSIPILTITGMYDGDQPGALRHYQEHLRHTSAAGRRAQHFLVIGPWDHAGTRTPRTQFGGLTFGPASLVDLPGLHLQWYAWAMQGGRRPEFLQKHVAYYVTGADKWRYADSLEEITSHFSTLFLDSTANPTDVFRSGSLAAATSTSSHPDRYTYDPRDVSHAALESLVDPESLVDQRMIHVAAGRQLIYHSAPFAEDTEVSGFFKLSVWLAIDQPDTDFIASIYAIDLSGGSIFLTADWIRARYRESLREEKLIGTREPLRYDFERFTFASRLIEKGDRLRLVVGPINSIYLQRNFNSGGTVSAESMQDARPVVVNLFHDELHPSALCIPVARPAA
jgi:putative CocE/NonD family hydrolase